MTLRNPHSSAIFAGFLSSALFLGVFGAGLGFIFMFLPTLPLFTLGLSGQQRPLQIALLVASVLIALVAGVQGAVLFLFFLGWPVWHMSRACLLWREARPPYPEHWFPVGIVMMHLTLYACGLVALLTLYYLPEPGGLPAIMARTVHETFADIEGEYGELVGMLADHWAFLVFSITIWLWGIALYAHAWLISRVLARKAPPGAVPDLAVLPFIPPAWMLSLLLISALASLIGGESMRFLGKSTLISLLLPYFFSGAAFLHAISRSWPSRRILLFFVYFFIFAQFWPALFLSVFGLWQQIKRLSAATNWSKR